MYIDTLYTYAYTYGEKERERERQREKERQTHARTHIYVYMYILYIHRYGCVCTDMFICLGYCSKTRLVAGGPPPPSLEDSREACRAWGFQALIFESLQQPSAVCSSVHLTTPAAYQDGSLLRSAEQVACALTSVQKATGQESALCFFFRDVFSTSCIVKAELDLLL